MQSIILSDADLDFHLRLLGHHDLPLFRRFYQDAEIMQYIGEPVSDDDIEPYFITCINSNQCTLNPPHLTYAIEVRQTTEPVGIIGLTWNPQEDRSRAEVGVMILAEWRRQGIGHWAKSTLITHALNAWGMDFICAYTQIKNDKANAANKKLGLKKGRILDRKVGRQPTQEWIADAREWNQS